LGLPASAHDLTGPGVLPYALAPMLMLGPLVANWFDRDLPFQRYSPYSTRERCTQFWKGLGLVEVRNYMVVSAIRSFFLPFFLSCCPLDLLSCSTR